MCAQLGVCCPLPVLGTRGSGGRWMHGRALRNRHTWAVWAPLCAHTGDHGHTSPSPAHGFSSLPRNQVARAGGGQGLSCRHPISYPPPPPSPQLSSSGLTQELDREIAGFSEQSPSDDDLLSRVERIPHDQGDAWGQGQGRDWARGGLIQSPSPRSLRRGQGVRSSSLRQSRQDPRHPLPRLTGREVLEGRLDRTPQITLNVRLGL